MIGKKLALLIACCAIIVPLSSALKKSPRPSPEQLQRERQEHYALIAAICYQSSKCIIGSYIALGCLLNSLGRPFNHPLLELYEVDRRLPFILMFPFAAIAYHGFTKLSKTLDTKKSTHRTQELPNQ